MDTSGSAFAKPASINLHYAGNILTEKQQVNIPFISLTRKSQAYIRPRRLFTEDFALSLPDPPSFLHRRRKPVTFLFLSPTGEGGGGRKENSPLFISSFSLSRFNNIPRFHRPSINFLAYLCPTLTAHLPLHLPLLRIVRCRVASLCESLERAMIHLSLDLQPVLSSLFLSLFLSVSLFLSSEMPLPKRTCCSSLDFAESDKRPANNARRESCPTEYIDALDPRRGCEKVDGKWIEHYRRRASPRPLSFAARFSPSSVSLSLSLSLFLSFSLPFSLFLTKLD